MNNTTKGGLIGGGGGAALGDYLLAVRHLGGNYDNLSDTEILRAQSGICLADALCGPK